MAVRANLVWAMLMHKRVVIRDESEFYPKDELERGKVHDFVHLSSLVYEIHH